ncbi:MAG: hypothetical protein AAF211_10690, partial [Myxococcota bacterium]
GGAFFSGFVSTYDGPVALGDDGTSVTDCIPGPDSAFSGISDILEDGDGGLVVGGSFASYGGVPSCDSVARIDADGQVDVAFCEAFPPRQAGVRIAIAGRTLYVGDRNNVVAFDLDSRTALATSPDMTMGPEQTLSDLAVVGGAVYVAARDLSAVGAVSVTGLGAFDATTLEALPFAPAIDDRVEVLAATTDQLWAGGFFDNVAGEARSGVAVFDATTRQLSAIAPQVEGFVFDLFEGPDGMWIAGSYETVGGTARPGIALVGLDGTIAADDLPIANADGTATGVFSVVEADGEVLVGGRFDRVDGEDRSNLARFRRSDTASLPVTRVRFEPDSFVIDDQIWLHAPNGIGLEARQGLALYDPVTQSVAPLDFALDNQFRSVHVDGDVAYVTGFFDSILGEPRDGIGAVDLTTGMLLPFDPEIDGVVGDIAFDADTAYVIGSFDTVEGQSWPDFAPLNKTDGSVKPGFAVDLFADNIRSIEISGDNLILGGLIREIDGIDRGDLVWLDRTTGNHAGIETTLDVAAHPVRLLDGELWVESFAFAATSGLPTDEEFFAIDPATGAIRNWTPGMQGGGIDSIAKLGDAVIIAGFEIDILGDRRPLWALDENTGAVLDWEPEFDGDPNVVFTYDGQIGIGTSRGELLFVAPPS